MPGTKRVHHDRKDNLKRARTARHPVVEPSPPSGTSNHSPITAPSASSPIQTTGENSDAGEDSDDGKDDDDDFLLVEEVAEIMTRFIELEEAGSIPHWDPECDSAEAMSEDVNSAAASQPSETSLEIFSQALQRLHDEERAREKKRRQTNDRSSGYTKNSKTTMLRQKKTRDEYAKSGGKFISDFMLKGAGSSSKTKEIPGQPNMEIDSEHEDVDTSSGRLLNRNDSTKIRTEQTDRGNALTPDIEEIPPPNPVPMDIEIPKQCPPPTAGFAAPATPDPTPQEARAELDKLKTQAAALQADMDESERALNALMWRDQPALKKALKGLSVKAKDKRIDVFFRTRITSMVATVNLYLDENVSCTWRQASMLAAKAQGRGSNHARNLRSWIHRFLSCGELPTHHYGEFHALLLEEEDFSVDLQNYLMEVAKEGYVSAQNVVDFVQTEEVQKHFEGKSGYNGTKPTIGIRTAQRWLKKLDWRYGKKKTGMYIDGHEREDVVAYRKAFCKRWKEYEKRMILYDKDGNEVSRPTGFAVAQGARFRLIAVTHDESTFFARDRRKAFYQHSSMAPTPERKGEGDSLMVSDFLTLEWGRLADGEDEGRWLFEAGKNRDGYFLNEHLLKQTDQAIDIFEAKTNRTATGLFLYDNAPTHLARAADALTARGMVKNPHATWTPKPNGPRMRNGFFADGREQQFYFPADHPTMPGWFKGSEIILRERGLYREGMNGACTKACFDTANTDCCCRTALFCQPDFVNQKSALEELIISRGHICDFYPKFHCELNFIEQYWGAAKFRYRSTPSTSNFQEMRANVVKCLDDVPVDQIRRYVNRSARFIHAYSEGLSGAQAALANRRYHGHHTLPPDMLAKAQAAI